MMYSKFKILFCLAVCLTMLLSPFTLDIIPDGKTQAYRSRSGDDGYFQMRKKPKTIWSNYKQLKTEGEAGAQTIHQVPEPATMLLVGAGLTGLAIFRRKIKK